MMPHFVRRGTSGTPSPTQDLEWDVGAPPTHVCKNDCRGRRPRQNSLSPLERKEMCFRTIRRNRIRFPQPIY